MAPFSPIRRASKAVPFGWLLLAGDLAMIAGRHVGRLEPDERRRLAALVAAGARRRGALEESERRELEQLMEKLEPRLLVGSAAKRVSPVPLPARLLFGRRGSAARRAAKDRR